WGPILLAIPARRARRRRMRAAPSRRRRAPWASRKMGPSNQLAGGQIDRPGRAGRQRDGDRLVALAVNAQSAVTPLQAKSVDVSAQGLGDAQAVQSEQARQGVILSRSEPGGNQEGTELVAIQAHG